MTRHRTLTIVLATAVSVLAMFWGGPPIEPGRLGMSEAEARIGRPATPLSYAGVARRTTRRAVAVGAAAGAAARTYPYPAPGCVQVVDAYGRIYYRCP